MTKKTVAMVLAGGRGTRMESLCQSRPKPLLSYGGKLRVIDFSLSNCVHSGMTNTAVLVDYRRNEVAEYLSQWRRRNPGADGLAVLGPGNGSYAGTADAVYRNLGFVRRQRADAVLVLAGDHVYKMDYRNMIAFHGEVRADVTVGVTHVPIHHAHRFGTVVLDACGRITEFVEKAPIPRCNLVSMGIYVFDHDYLATRLAEDAGRTASGHDFGYSILPASVKRDRAFGYKYDGYWRDIGTVEAYYQANMDLLGPESRFDLGPAWPILTDGDTLEADLGARVNVENSLIGRGCSIKGRVENSILSPGVSVEDGAVVRDSVVMAGASMGCRSVVKGCIVDEGVRVADFCRFAPEGGPASHGEGIMVLGKDIMSARPGAAVREDAVCCQI